MSMEPVVSQDYEQILSDTVRVLPPERVEQLVDFARFLEAQTLAEWLIQEESSAEIEADNARWDTLLATDDAQTLLENLANEALAEHRAGETRPMIFDDEGQITPG